MRSRRRTSRSWSGSRSAGSCWSPARSANRTGTRTPTSLDGTVDTDYLQPGDAYFVPRAYPHQIEVIGDDPIHFCIFFDQPTPGDIVDWL